MQLIQGSVNTGIEIDSSSSTEEIIEILKVASTLGELSNLSAYEWRCSYQVESVRCRAFLRGKKAVIPTVAPYNTQLERQAIMLEIEENSQTFKVEFYTGEDGVNWRQMPSQKFLWYRSEYLEEIYRIFWRRRI